MPLTIEIVEPERFKEETSEFIPGPIHRITLEHSLISISKWESKWHKAYLEDKNKTPEEILDYIKCMCISNNIKDEVYNFLSQENINEIVRYIEDPMTAVQFYTDDKTKSTSKEKEIVTSELIYHWMITLEIPVEFQKWHLNRLLTLIKLRQNKIEESDPKNKNKRKFSKAEQQKQIQLRERLNEQRKAKLGSKG